MAASMGGSEGLVRELVRLGAEVNARSNEGYDALMDASGNGHAAVIAVLLDNGVDPNSRNEGWTALGLAAIWDHLPVCQLLLGRGADLLAINAYPGVNFDASNYGRFGGETGNALEGYGSMIGPRLTPAILEERREALRVAFAEGPHGRQKRRNERWARRWPFMLVLAGSGFRPLEFPRSLGLLEKVHRFFTFLVISEATDAPLTRRDECVCIVFRADNLVRLIVSFL